MEKATSQAGYHVTGVFYFNQGQELGGSTIAKLWSGTSLFGDYKVTGSFWDVPTNIRKTPKFQLGSFEPFQHLLESENQPIYGGGVYVNPRSVTRNEIVDQDFYYANCTNSRQFGCPTEPFLLYSVSSRWFEEAGPENVLVHMREHFEAADAVNSPYGFLDLSLSEDCYAGRAFIDAGWVDNIPQHRWVDEIKWVHARANNKVYARGVYWGNYFGSQILEQLGGRTLFLNKYRAQIDNQEFPPRAIIWEFKNGIFVSICANPMGCRPGYPVDGSIGGNMGFLLRELGSNGMLNPW